MKEYARFGVMIDCSRNGDYDVFERDFEYRKYVKLGEL